MEQSLEILNVSTTMWRFVPWMWFTLCHNSSCRVDESKSIRPLRFCVMTGKDTWSFRSEWEVEKSASRLPTNQQSTESYLESMEDRFGSSEKNFPGRTSLQLLQKMQEDVNVRKRKPKQFEGIILFMSMFNDIVWTKKGFREGKRLRKKISARTLIIPRSWTRKIRDMERTLINRKESEMKSPIILAKTSKEVDIRYSEVLLRSSEESVEELRFTLLRNLRV